MHWLTAHRGTILLATAAMAVAALLLHGPIAQEAIYHRFADQRTLFGMPNGWNVATNLPFLLVGCHGLLLLARKPGCGLLQQLRAAYLVVFAGLIVLAPASAWYHLDPRDTTLLWDRLPITLVFMALFAAILGEHVGAAFGRRSLPVLLLLGLASLFWWRATGDLRLYVLVQFLPLLLLPLILLLYGSPWPGRGCLWLMLGIYALAKLAEGLDAVIYQAIGFSGHSIKHLLAALAAWMIALRVRAQPAQ
ncbi:hypothetical protein [Piscinibacter sakaiensis]|uniref:hypothetical protein n=1 Tax=Piscinibacter sakaiensis TaxID=1547922 RepID=UPI003AAA629A